METKKCPYCGEEILAVAKKCKHCGEWLDKQQESSNPVANYTPSEAPTIDTVSHHNKPKKKQGWLIVAIVLILGLIVFATSQNRSEKEYIDDDETMVVAQEVEVPEVEDDYYVEEEPYCQAYQDYTSDYKGTIGNMSINLSLGRVHDVDPDGVAQIEGVYWYGNGANGKLQLEGTINQDQIIQFKEYNSDGKCTGIWKLKYIENGASVRLTGTMTNAKGQDFSVECKKQTQHYE